MCIFYFMFIGEFIMRIFVGVGLFVCDCLVFVIVCEVVVFISCKGLVFFEFFFMFCDG